MHDFEERIKTWARDLGFDLVGIAPATSADGFDRYQDWLAQGFAGEMAYMRKHGEARRHPRAILPEVRSVVMVALNYFSGDNCGAGGRDDPAAPGTPPNPSALAAPTGKIARYARGRDYHDVLREKLKALLARIQVERPSCGGRGVVDTAPLLERDFARRAGLGWFGKNTMLLNKRLGSFFFLGALLLDLELNADPPHEASHCGTCTACLDACPTQAFVAPGQLDSRRCISYLTIELRGSVPNELREGIGEWVFGCDVCQDVCPWNRKTPISADANWSTLDGLEELDLVDLLGLSESEFQRRFGKTAIARTRRAGLIRNAILVLGNRGDHHSLDALGKVQLDPDLTIKEAAAWAIAKIRARAARTKMACWQSAIDDPASPANSSSSCRII